MIKKNKIKKTKQVGGSVKDVGVSVKYKTVKKIFPKISAALGTGRQVVKNSIISVFSPYTPKSRASNMTSSELKRAAKQLFGPQSPKSISKILPHNQIKRYQNSTNAIIKYKNLLNNPVKTKKFIEELKQLENYLKSKENYIQKYNRKLAEARSGQKHFYITSEKLGEILKLNELRKLKPKQNQEKN